MISQTQQNFKQVFMPWDHSLKLGIHIGVCVYVVRLAAYDFSAFEYHA